MNQGLQKYAGHFPLHWIFHFMVIKSYKWIKINTQFTYYNTRSGNSMKKYNENVMSVITENSVLNLYQHPFATKLYNFKAT